MKCPSDSPNYGSLALINSKPMFSPCDMLRLQRAQRKPSYPKPGAAFETLSLDLVDRHTSTLILEEVKSRSFESLASTLAVAITTLLTIFSASLFYATTLPAESHVQLKPGSLIYYSPDGNLLSTGEPQPGFGVGTLILLQNASYPACTYEDLAFPGLDLDSTAPSHSAQSRVVYNVTVPAVRPNFSNCRLYNSSQIDAITDTASSPGDTYLNITIQAEEGCSYRDTLQILVEKTAHDDIYFASTHTGCSSQLWVWGSWANISSDDIKARVDSVHAFGCNDTLQTVETSVEFAAQTMIINPDNPPIPNYANAANLASFEPMRDLGFYQYLPDIATTRSGTNFDQFFSIMMGSRYAIPVSYLGDASQASTVADSIQFHHRILVAQFLNHEFRVSNHTTALNNINGILPVWDKPTVFNTTARDPAGRNRVLQDVAST
ncbi:hypothetical protein F4823DRAFT_634435 [Ustulina deusta]|nr:hypothetical protein F4823DRAFT_634435 [Ustulina deusta]